MAKRPVKTKKAEKITVISNEEEAQALTGNLESVFDVQDAGDQIENSIKNVASQIESQSKDKQTFCPDTLNKTIQAFVDLLQIRESFFNDEPEPILSGYNENAMVVQPEDDRPIWQDKSTGKMGFLVEDQEDEQGFSYKLLEFEDGTTESIPSVNLTFIE